MCGSDVVVGAPSLEALEHAIRSSVRALGLAIVRTMDVANVSERYEAVGHLRTLSIGALDDGVFAVRDARPELGRLLSSALGAWAAARDDHEEAYFLDGFTLERGAAEDRRYLANLERLACVAAPWPPRGAFRVLLLEPAKVVEAVPPSTGGILVVDEASAIRAPSLDVVTNGAAFATDGIRAWAKSPDARFVEAEGEGLARFLAAWSPLAAIGVCPMLITFPRPAGPFR
jgi:hypothetical protein